MYERKHPLMWVWQIAPIAQSSSNHRVLWCRKLDGSPEVNNSRWRTEDCTIPHAPLASCILELKVGFSIEPCCPLHCLEWTSSHQCTSWGWTRSTRFADEHPPCPSRFFFHLLSALKFSTSPLLPTTYQPHPPSFHRQSSRDLERLWSGSWSCGCGVGVGTVAAGAGAGTGPTRPRKGKMLTFFFCLFCLKKAWEVFFFLFLCYTTA